VTKVMCINKAGNMFITEGEVYDVISTTGNMYRIKDDNEEYSSYYMSRFEAVEEDKEDGVKYDTGKLRMELIPPEAIEALAEVITYGANKYSDDNWKKVGKDRYIGALMRHLNAYRKGELYDDESGLTHMAHILTNAAFLIYKEENDE